MKHLPFFATILLHILGVFYTPLTTHYYLMGTVFYKRTVILWKKCGLNQNFSIFMIQVCMEKLFDDVHNYNKDFWKLSPVKNGNLKELNH